MVRGATRQELGAARLLGDEGTSVPRGASDLATDGRAVRPPPADVSLGDLRVCVAPGVVRALVPAASEHRGCAHRRPDRHPGGAVVRPGDGCHRGAHLAGASDQLPLRVDVQPRELDPAPDAGDVHPARPAAERAPGWYAVVVACHFVSAQIDWQGNFMVPALFLFELLQPKGTRRIGRVVMLGIASILSTGAVIVAHGFFLTVNGQSRAMVMSGAGGPAPAWELSRITDYAAAGIRNTLAMARGSIHAEAAIDVQGWFAAQGRNAVAMFTWPGALATAAGVAWFAVSRRRTLLPGVVLLVPGVLNIVLFRRYWDHEFWPYHAAAGVAITTAELCRLLPWKFVGVAIVAGIVGFSAYGVHDRLESWRTNDYRDGARELDELLENPDDILVCDGRASLLTFYMRHWVVARATPESLDDVYAMTKAGRIANPMVVLVISDASLPRGASEVELALGRFGTVRGISADEVAAPDASLQAPREPRPALARPAQPMTASRALLSVNPLTLTGSATAAWKPTCVPTSHGALGIGRKTTPPPEASSVTGPTGTNPEPMRPNRDWRSR